MISVFKRPRDASDISSDHEVVVMSTFILAKTRFLTLLVVTATAAALWTVATSERWAAVLIVLAAGAGCLFLLSKASRLEARRASEAGHRESQREFIDSLQVSRGEAEAHRIVKRHLERIVRGAAVTVLIRNDAESLLEAAELDPSAPLAERLVDAEPLSCLAIRLGRVHGQGAGHEPLLSCEVCSQATGASVCIPSLVGGEAIGSVLVQESRGRAIDAETRQRVKDSVDQAAPVLANLRNLALAHARAGIDALTGLPNSRTLRDTLKRMIAQAGRTGSPLSAILLDLDQFRRINDTHGHERGDDALAAVGDVVASTVRASDYAGRYGGEEFLVLLPDTDRDGAILVAEKLRQAIVRIALSGLDRSLTASLGVATMPPEGGDADALLRLADRALHAAKSGGRNRVEAAGLSVATPVVD
jgi:diguanylate cyclase (GGDEF)-like protein